VCPPFFFFSLALGIGKSMVGEIEGGPLSPFLSLFLSPGKEKVGGGTRASFFLLFSPSPSPPSPRILTLEVKRVGIGINHVHPPSYPPYPPLSLSSASPPPLLQQHGDSRKKTRCGLADYALGVPPPPPLPSSPLPPNATGRSAEEDIEKGE